MRAVVSDKLQALLPQLLLIAAGSSTTLAFAPFTLWWLPLCTVALLVFWLNRAAAARSAALAGFSFGIGWFGAGISWVHVSIAEFGGLPLAGSLALMALLVAYLALFPAFASWLSYKLRCLPVMPLLFAACWTLAEWLRSFLFTGFPWNAIGYAAMPVPLMMQSSYLLGILAITPLAVYVFAAPALLGDRRIESPEDLLDLPGASAGQLPPPFDTMLTSLSVGEVTEPMRTPGGFIMLKLLEMRSPRDALVVIYLGFFIVATAFLFDQGIPLASVERMREALARAGQIGSEIVVAAVQGELTVAAGGDGSTQVALAQACEVSCALAGLHQQRDQAKADMTAEAKADPLVKAILSQFPGAEVRVVEKLETVPVEAYLDAVRDEDEEDEL